jgi:phage shock protein C
VTDRLYRSPDDRMLAGVAGGVAEALDVDPSIVRVVWALLVFLTGGIALVVYVVMAVVVPERPPGAPVGGDRPWSPGGASAGAGATGDPASAGPVPTGSWRAPDGSTVPQAPAPPRAGRRARDPADRARVGVVIGIVLIGLGAIFAAQRFLPDFDVSLWWPVLAIAAGIVLLVAALLPPRRPG